MINGIKQWEVDILKITICKVYQNYEILLFWSEAEVQIMQMIYRLVIRSLDLRGVLAYTFLVKL